jgi:hypothetical protein
MRISHGQQLALIWLLLSVLLTVFLSWASRASIENAVQDRLKEHLLLTLDESNFGNAQNRANDQKGLQRIGQQINVAMQNLVATRWYSVYKQCKVQLQRIDDVTIEDESLRWSSNFDLLRNQIERKVEVGLSCSTNWWVVICISGVLGLLFAAIYRLLPPPLSKTHRQWINYLLERGYSGAQAFAIIRGYTTATLSMSPAQLACLEQLHDGEQGNFHRVLEVVTDARVARLDNDAVEWLLLGLRTDTGDLARALELAGAADSVVIDLNEMTLSIRGLNVPISRTPLFYYAWYAMHRIEGDGWMTNPASNRPDMASGRDLIELMSRFDGHAKAINDLERTGLKARTLDQNRSKIKDELVAALGEKLAGNYLFEASKHPDGIHMRYRLRVEAPSIHFVT